MDFAQSKRFKPSFFKKRYLKNFFYRNHFEEFFYRNQWSTQFEHISLALDLKTLVEKALVSKVDHIQTSKSLAELAHLSTSSIKHLF
jgi:hypothetical protein